MMDGKRMGYHAYIRTTVERLKTVSYHATLMYVGIPQVSLMSRTETHNFSFISARIIHKKDHTFNL